MSSAYTVLIPSPEIEPRFFSHLFKSQIYIQALQATSNLVRDGQALRFENFAQVRLPVFYVNEQIAIADFLDTEVALIDARIANLESNVIELLHGRRAAIFVRSQVYLQALQKNEASQKAGSLPKFPIDEQQSSHAAFGREISTIDALVADVTTASELLQERRTALISSAVTGKLDVRALSPDQFEKVTAE